MQRLSVQQRLRIVGITAEVMQVLLHRARRGYRFAQVVQRPACSIELRLAFLQPVFYGDIAIVTTIVDVQLVQGVNGDGVLHLFEQLFVVDDVTIILVVAVEPVRTIDGLLQTRHTELRLCVHCSNCRAWLLGSLGVQVS